MSNRLFDNIFPVDESPIDETRIRQVLLYYSEDEAVEFKQLCKTGMKKEYPDSYKDSNIQDFLLKILRERYATTNGQEDNDGSASRFFSEDIPE